MTQFMNLVRAFRAYTSNLFRCARWPIKTVWVNEVPLKLKKRTLYLVGESGHLWQAVMLCPNNCGSILNMNLNPDDRPLWKLTCHDDHTVSLHPSIWRQVGCRAHFWLRKSKIEWAMGD